MKKFLGKTFEEYFITIYSEDEDLEECDFSNLSTFFHSWRSGDYNHLIRLCRYSVLNEYSGRGCVPKGFDQAPIDGVKKQLHDLLLRYSDLNPFRKNALANHGNRYYKTLYADFVNLIVAEQTGRKEPAVIVQRKDQLNIDLIFQPVLHEAVAGFDKENNFVARLKTPMIEIIEKIADPGAKDIPSLRSGGKINKALAWQIVQANLIDDRSGFLRHYLLPLFNQEFDRISAEKNLDVFNADLVWVEE